MEAQKAQLLKKRRSLRVSSKTVRVNSNEMCRNKKMRPTQMQCHNLVNSRLLEIGLGGKTENLRGNRMRNVIRDQLTGAGAGAGAGVGAGIPVQYCYIFVG